MHPATQALREEHDAILRVLDVTEESARRIGQGREMPAEVLNGVLEFLKLYADRRHHGKEEDLLFPALERKGMPRQGGPIGVMLQEHEQGRALIRAMSEAAAAYSSGDGTAGARWSAPAIAYVALLREHIYKENNILFVMAERMLAPEEQAALATAYARAEAEAFSPAEKDRLNALLEKLCAAVAAP